MRDRPRSAGMPLLIVLLLATSFQVNGDGSGEPVVERAPGTIITSFDLVPVSSTPIEGVGRLFSIEGAVGDLDQDGHLDLVLPHGHATLDDEGQIDGGGVRLAIALGDGTGAFADLSMLPIEQSSLFTQIAEMDRDSYPDVLLCEWKRDEDGIPTPWAVILHGDEHARYSRRTEWQIMNSVVSLLPADLNDDGYVDVIALHTEPDTGEIAATTWRGGQNGDFAHWRTSTSDSLAGVLFTPACVVLADMNLDGVDDIVCIGSLGSGAGPTRLLVASGLRDGSFRFQPHELIDGARLPTDLEIGDFDGNGHSDVAVSFPFDVASVVEEFLETGSQKELDKTSHVLVLLQGQEGSWEEVRLDSGVQPIAIDASDTNADGLTDIIAYGARGGISVSLGSSAGLEVSSSVYATSNPAPALSNLVGDFDEDGHLDLCTQSPGGTLVVRKGNGAGGLDPGWFSTPLDVAIPFGEQLLSDSLDYDGDGNADLVFWESYVGVGVIYGDGLGGFGDAQELLGLPSMKLRGITAGDFNGDSKPDIAVAVEDEASGGTGSLVYVLPGGPRSTTGQALLSHESEGWIRDIHTVDTDRNGVDDLMAVFSGRRLPCTLEGQPDGTMRLGEVLELPFDGWFSILDSLSADFNHDGRSDLLCQIVISPWREFMTLWLSTTPGEGYEPIAFEPFVYIGGTWDVNLDGALDFLGWDPETPSEWVFLGDGTGDFEQLPTSRLTSYGADLDRDGHVDGASASGVLVGIELGGAFGESEEFAQFAGRANPENVLSGDESLGDFNNDGWIDVALIGNSMISVLLNQLQRGR